MSASLLRKFQRGVGIALPVVLLLLFTLFPIYWLVNSSLKSDAELFAFPPRYWPAAPNLASFQEALRGSQVPTQYVNSIITAGLTCVLLTVLIIFSGYALARFRFRGQTMIMVLFLLAQMLPAAVLLVPLFRIYSGLGLINTRWVLPITYTMTMLPFSVMMMRNFFATIPVELDEAAMVDGCNRTGALRRVVLPAALPGLVATAIFGFINSWNELIFAVVFINSRNLQTIPVGLKVLMDYSRSEYGALLAVALLAVVPSLILFGYIQRFLTGGLTAGAVRG